MRSTRWTFLLVLGLLVSAGAVSAAEPSSPNQDEATFLAELATEVEAAPGTDDALAEATPALALRAECTEGATSLLWNGCCSPQLDRYTPFVCQGGVWVRQTSYCQPVVRFRCTFN